MFGNSSYYSASKKYAFLFVNSVLIFEGKISCRQTGALNGAIRNLMTCYGLDDYGVVIKPIDPLLCSYQIDWQATEREREFIRKNRKGWLHEDPSKIEAQCLKGELDDLDLIRRYGVIIDRQRVLPHTTKIYRRVLEKKSAMYWT